MFAKKLTSMAYTPETLRSAHVVFENEKPFCEESQKVDPKLNLDSPLSYRRKQTRRNSVEFNIVHIRSYPVEIGDHPLCSEGCPITIQWKHSREDHFDIDEFKATRRRSPSLEALRITGKQRKNCSRAIFQNGTFSESKETCTWNDADREELKSLITS